MVNKLRMKEIINEADYSQKYSSHSNPLTENKFTYSLKETE